MRADGCTTGELGIKCGLCEHGQGELQRLRAEVENLETRKAVLLGTQGACKFNFESIIWAASHGFPDRVLLYARDGLNDVTQPTGGGE